MPQLHLPLFPIGSTDITEVLSYCRTDETVTYFHYGLPIFSHAKDDRASFRFITALLHVTCGAKQAELVNIRLTHSALPKQKGSEVFA